VRSSRKPADAFYLTDRYHRFWERFVLQREQAPSPQRAVGTGYK